MKRFATALLIILLFTSTPVFAISNSKSYAIVAACDSIEEIIFTMRKEDSYVRLYLGAGYESTLNNFIAPLNSRLSKNNIINTVISNNYTEFVSAHNNFNNDFTIYSKSLENLSKISCKTHPEEYYEQLELVRQNREIVRQDTFRMNYLINKQKNAVIDLRDSL